MTTNGNRKAPKSRTRKRPSKANGEAARHLPPASAALRARAAKALSALRDVLWVAERIARGEGSESKSERAAVKALESAAEALRNEGAANLATLRVTRAITLLNTARRGGRRPGFARSRALAGVIAAQEDANRERRADALCGIPAAAWAKAIGDWRGETTPTRGNPHGRYVWSKVVWELLRAGKLTGATNARNLRDAYNRATG